MLLVGFCLVVHVLGEREERAGVGMSAEVNNQEGGGGSERRWWR